MGEARNFARKAEKSAEKMSHLTKEMHVISAKTIRETISMRVIAIVTLFFLPGTFVSVSSF